MICDPKGNLLVDGRNRQILTFDPNGEFTKSFRIEKFYARLAIDDEGRIYGNYLNREYKKEDLIEVLDPSGVYLSSFGKRVLFKNITLTHNQAFLDVSLDQRLFQAWEKFNIYRIYSLEGRLLREGKFAHRAFDDITDLNLESKMIDHQFRFQTLFVGMCEDGGKFFLFKYYPRMEIFKSNDRGEIEQVYWFKTGYNYIGRDLFVVHRNGRRYFVTLQVFPEERVEVYSIADDASS